MGTGRNEKKEKKKQTEKVAVRENVEMKQQRRKVSLRNNGRGEVKK